VAHAGQEIGNPGGINLLLVRTGDQTEGELLEMEATYPGDGSMPPMHLHPSQAEHFEILEGSMRTVIDGEERVYESGESFEVPANTPHQMGTDQPTRMRWEVRPALRTAEFFERIYGGAPGGPADLGAKFFAEFEDEFRLV
jgi:mannose-6-phosphate isomerase-like protein (cupin superfamily)